MWNLFSGMGASHHDLASIAVADIPHPLPDQDHNRVSSSSPVDGVSDETDSKEGAFANCSIEDARYIRKVISYSSKLRAFDLSFSPSFPWAVAGQHHCVAGLDCHIPGTK